jgi:hypothetical protein
MIVQLIVPLVLPSREDTEMVVGLRGLEPLTSSLSGKRSNRLSYRPVRHLQRAGPSSRESQARDARRYPTVVVCSKTALQTTTSSGGTEGFQSSVSVTCSPPTRLAQTLYRKAPSVEIAVIKMTSMTAMTIESDTTRPSPM